MIFFFFFDKALNHRIGHSVGPTIQNFKLAGKIGRVGILNSSPQRSVLSFTLLCTFTHRYCTFLFLLFCDGPARTLLRACTVTASVPVIVRVRTFAIVAR